MTDELDKAIEAIGGIPLKRYCQITGELPNAIYQRKFRKVWLEGVHLTRPNGGDWWVDLAMVNAWRLQNGLDNLVPIIKQKMRDEGTWKPVAKQDSVIDDSEDD